MERTKMAIIAAFEALLEEKPFNKITVKDIVERCQINRNTFYYHYRDIPDLLQHMLEGKVDRLLSGHYIPDCPMACISPIFQYGLEHKRAILSISTVIPHGKPSCHIWSRGPDIWWSSIFPQWPKNWG